VAIETRTCTVCGTEFQFNAKPYSVARGFGRFCSQRCHGVATWGRREVRACLSCGTEREVRLPPSVLKRNGGWFCSTACSTIFHRTGKPSNHWRGGSFANRYGRILTYRPEHPHANVSGYVYEHRLVMERHLGRILDRSEKVHHINGNPADNRIENLAVMSQSEHMSLHMKARHAAMRSAA
jgi:hypothetical protein